MVSFRRFLPYLIILVLLIIIKNNILSILDSLGNIGTTANLRKQLEASTKENKYLQERLKYVNTDQFVEEQAQEKLGMLKPGEYFVIAPTSTPPNTIKQVFDTKPNWQKWLELFF